VVKCMCDLCCSRFFKSYSIICNDLHRRFGKGAMHVRELVDHSWLMKIRNLMLREVEGSEC
jgi:hypothetical protein